MNDVTVSSAARRRIRAFSVWVWVCGALVLSFGAFTTYTGVGIGDDGFGIIGGGGNPWEVREPVVFEADGTTYSGEGSGLIRIPLEEHNQEPYILRLVAGEYLDFFVSEADDIGLPAADRGWPTSLANLYDPADEALLLPPDVDLELWVRTDTPWEFTLQRETVTEITDGFAAGTGNGILVYRGDAVSARFLHRGDGVFFVSLQLPGERSDRPIIETGEVDQRLSWNPTTAVYFTIESDDGRGAWTIDIDELATDDPSPAESPEATP